MSGYIQSNPLMNCLLVGWLNELMSEWWIIGSNCHL